MNIYKEIIKNVKSGKYKEALDDIYTYFSIPEFGVNARILVQYVTCLYNLGYFEKAEKQLDLIEKEYPDVSRPWLIESYIKSNAIEKAKKRILEENPNIHDLNRYGKAFFSAGYYDDAKACFKIVWENTENGYYHDTAKHFQQIILDHNLTNQFIKIDYIYYCLHNELSPGDIFYTKIENDLPKEERMYRRPMMIWKIEDEDVYAFPISKKTIRENGKTKGFLIHNRKYKNFDGNRALKYNLVKVKKSDIGRMIEKIDKDDLKKLLDSNYAIIHRIGTEEAYTAGDKFIKEYKLILEPECITNTLDSNRNRKYYYLKTLDETKQNGYGYELELIDDMFYIKNPILQKIPADETIISYSKPYQELKNVFSYQVRDFPKRKIKRGPHEE